MTGPLDLRQVFQQCPRCGAQLAPEGPKATRCPLCEFIFYFNPAAAVGALIRNARGEVLMLSRAQEPRRGMLDVPGGFVDFGENLHDALRREVSEELGMTISNIRFFNSYPNEYPFKGILYTTVDVYFLCSTDDPFRATPSEEVTDPVFMDARSIDPDVISFPSLRSCIADLAQLSPV